MLKYNNDKGIRWLF